MFIALRPLHCSFNTHTDTATYKPASSKTKSQTRAVRRLLSICLLLLLKFLLMHIESREFRVLSSVRHLPCFSSACQRTILHSNQKSAKRETRHCLSQMNNVYRVRVYTKIAMQYPFCWCHRVATTRFTLVQR